VFGTSGSLAASGRARSRFPRWRIHLLRCDAVDNLEQQIFTRNWFLRQHVTEPVATQPDFTIGDRRLDFGFDSRLGVGDVVVASGEWTAVRFLRLVAITTLAYGVVFVFPQCV